MAKKQEKKIRVAVIDREKCNPVGCGDYLCMRVCPVNKQGEECITKGSHHKPLINEELCIGCGICPARCPFDAITVVNLPHDLAQQPLHQYGPSQFRVYNLATPIFGKVVGVLGQNGIGKTTILNILSGETVPNLGELEKKPDYKQVIEFFKGTENQAYFEKLKDKKIKLAYKPQYIEKIPQKATGQVKTLLKKLDQKNQFDYVVKELDLEKILNRKLGQLSGGELQRVAIAATVLKDANIYFFDEPTSYLDIKQRIRVAKFIRSLVDDETAVVVVEHDLLILDYLTDLIHIVYGQPNAYGIVNLVKSTKNAINTYLEGYLKEANVRFRDHQIKFSEKPPVSKLRGGVLVDWQKMEKKLDTFQLIVNPGDVNKQEVVGVLGENGIGKTTMVKLMAGELSPGDKKQAKKEVPGLKQKALKISYKPQYIPRDGSVGEALAEAMQYKNILIDPLGLAPLLDKNLKQLSGGQLQAVAIAKCLGADADLYLLDEPSAYLDVEQRLRVAKILDDLMFNKAKAALVVDHDLLFIDYLANRLLVFEGQPALKGQATGPFNMRDGMNKFLTELNITMRRDEITKRPRINKEGSVKDREQKQKGDLYYG